MARRARRNEASALTGLSDALVFLLFVASGAGFIVWAKLTGLSAAQVTAVPVVLMLIYAGSLLFLRSLKLREDQGGDNLYYMGFLFTLTSLAVSLWQFDASGAAEDIVRNFGIAIASTIAGIALRIFMNQMRRDPVEVERVSRLELADAARRVRRELDSTVVELNQFRRATQQSGEEALADAQDRARSATTQMVEETRLLAAQTAALTEAVSVLTERLTAVLPQPGAAASAGREAAGEQREAAP